MNYKKITCMLLSIGMLSTSTGVMAANINAVGTFEQTANTENKETATDYIEKINQLENRSAEALAYASSQCENYPEDPGLQEAKKFIEEEIEFIALAKKNIENENNNTIWSYNGFSYANENAIEIISKLEAEAERSFYQIKNTDLSADYFYGFVGIEEERKAIVEAALSMEGNIPYSWGVKPTDNTKENVSATGLDCSGFVEWVYWNATGEDKKDLASTYNITHNLEEISYEDLKPGDIVTIFDDGSYYTDETGMVFYNEKEASEIGTGLITSHTNHTGIYVGKDENGLDVFVHCKGGSDRNVVVTTEEEFGSFSKYYRAL